MTITIADGRGALWQWDTGRRVKITDGGVKQIHYQNRCFGRSVDVDVGDDGTAIIPDELLQDWHTLTAYAYVTDDAGGYTKVQVNFAVHKRAKPADYVYTPAEHAGFDRLRTEIGDLSALQTDAKDTLVAAINEAAASGGSESIGLRVADGYIQYGTDGGSTWTNLIAVADLKGAKGDTGPQGPVGATGAKGDTGAKGSDGVTPTIGANGNWYIGSTDTGKPSRGAQGIQGLQGAKGDTGEQGPQGVKGDTGDTGHKGDKGDTGAQGIKGDKGDKGDKGADGSGVTDKSLQMPDVAADAKSVGDKLTIMADVLAVIASGTTPTVATYSQINDTVQQYLTESKGYKEGGTDTVIGKYVTTESYSNNYDNPVGYGSGYSGDCKVIGGKTYEYTIPASNPLYNLVPGKTSLVCVGTTLLSITPTGALRMIYMSGSAQNIRDLGGWACDGGTVPYGHMLRGGALNSGANSFLNDLDQATMSKVLGVTLELDLRGSGEAGITTSVIDGADYYCTNDMSVGSMAYNLAQSYYRKTIEAVTKLFETVVAGGVVYFHCAAGADRTGELAKIAEAVLGVSRTDCDRDYELTCFSGWQGYHDRTRSNSTWVGGNTYLATMTGGTWRDKIIYWLRKAGMSMELINAYRKTMGCAALSDPLDSSGGGGDSAEDVNLISISTDTDGSIFNGTGYMADSRLNSSGVVRAQSGVYVTGFMPIKKGQTIKFENMKIAANTGMSRDYSYIALYDSAKTLVCSQYTYQFAQNPNNAAVSETIDKVTANLLQLTLNGSGFGNYSLDNVAYFRVSCLEITSESAIYVS